MNYFYLVLQNIINGILLVLYYAPFLDPKSKRRCVAWAGFGCIFVLTQIMVDFLSFFFIYVVLTGTDFLIVRTTILVGRDVVMAVITFLLSLLLFQKEIGKQIFLSISFFAIQDISQHIFQSLGSTVMFRIIWLFERHSLPELTPAYFSRMEHIFGVTVLTCHAAITLFAIKSIQKSFTYKKHSLSPSEYVTLILPCLTGFAVTQSLWVLLSDADSYIRSNLDERAISWIFIFLTAVFFLLMIIVSVRSFQKTIHLHMEEKNQTILREQIRYIQNQDTNGAYSELGGLRHDMKNHLTNIRLLTKAYADGNPEILPELEHYLGKMNDTVEQFDFVFQTGHSVSDIIIHQKYLAAKRKNIRFTSDFAYPAELGLDIYDLAVILGNALDNAGEACDFVPEQQRFIRLHSRIKGNLFFIKLENSYARPLSMNPETGLPATGKPDGTSHGLGLFNIRRCAQKYYGNIDIQLTENDNTKIFCLTIMMQSNHIDD